MTRSFTTIATTFVVRPSPASRLAAMASRRDNQNAIARVCSHFFCPYDQLETHQVLPVGRLFVDSARLSELDTYLCRLRQYGADLMVVERFDPERSRFALDVDAKLTRLLRLDEERLLCAHCTTPSVPHSRIFTSSCTRPHAHRAQPGTQQLVMHLRGAATTCTLMTMRCPRLARKLAADAAGALLRTGLQTAHPLLQVDEGIYSSGLRHLVCSKQDGSATYVPIAVAHRRRTQPKLNTFVRCVRMIHVSTPAGGRTLMM